MMLSLLGCANIVERAWNSKDRDIDSRTAKDVLLGGLGIEESSTR